MGIENQYFENIEKEINRLYEIAKKARSVGIDPYEGPEVKIAHDIAARVESIVGPRGVAKRIRELTKIMNREEMAFKIAEEIVYGKFSKEKISDEEIADQSVRTALAVLTEGVTAAPIEGISKIKIRKNFDNSEYLAIYFSGPIRAAGGTEAALTVLVGDWVRRLLHLDRYKPTDEEVERYVEEVKLYERAVHTQISTTSEEIRRAARNLFVEVTGEPTEKDEVSGFRDLERVKTNRLRGGAVLVLNDGLIGRSHKLAKIIAKISIEGWEWLSELKLEDRVEEEGVKIKTAPDIRYLDDVIAGRPVFALPASGGFRIRYGRSRNTGLAAVGIHPATMVVLDSFLAPGTHMRTERPGKGSVVLPVDCIEGPVVKLKDGSVLRIKNIDEAKRIFSEIDEILFLGDLLISFGEFLENNHPMLPAGYCEEWWAKDLEISLRKQIKDGFMEKLSESNLTFEKIRSFIENPFQNHPSEIESVYLSNLLNIPLHPDYTYFWHDISPDELKILRTHLLTGEIIDEEGIVTKIMSREIHQDVKRILERLCIPHSVIDKKIIIQEHAHILSLCLALKEKDIEINMSKDVLDIVSELSGLKILAKAPIYIGARMGRPEKAKERKMSPPVHVLFPVGNEGGKSRNIIEAASKNMINVELIRKNCSNCQTTTFLNFCPECGEKTVPSKLCGRCNTVVTQDICPACGGETRYFVKQDIAIKRIFEKALRKIGDTPTHKIKGVKGLTNAKKIPELLEKGILRAKNDVYVYRDGTARFDATDTPLTHFTPKEIGTSIKKLKQLGYEYDIEGAPLENENQILELKVQDIVISNACADYLLKVAKFVDGELEKIYDLPPYYQAEIKEDLVGHLVIGLSPHTSAGITGRIIGFTDAYVGFAHPYFHAAKRRNCLHFSSELPIWDTKKQELITTSIGQFVDNAFKLATTKEIVDDFGTQTIDNPYPHLRVISLDPETNQLVFQPINKWVKGQSSIWIQLTTRTGRELAVTPNHRMLIYDPITEKYTIKPARLLLLGDLIPVPHKLSLPERQPPKEINILQEFSEKLPQDKKFTKFRHHLRLRNAKKWIEQKLQTHAKNLTNNPYLSPKVASRIAAQALIPKMPKEPFKQHAIFEHDWKNSIPLSHLEVLIQEKVLEWNEIPHIAKLSMAKDDSTVDPYLPFNTDLMRLLGYYIAEGYIKDMPPGYQINFSLPDPKLREHVRQLILKLFKKEPYFKKDTQQLCHTSRIHAYLLAYAWKIGCNAYEKRIPSFIYTLPSKMKYEFLSAIIDGDGSVVTIGKELSICTANKLLAKDYSILLSSLQIFTRHSKTIGKRYGGTVSERYNELGVEPKESSLYHVDINGYDIKPHINSLKLMKKNKSSNLNAFKTLMTPDKQKVIQFADDLILDKIVKIEQVHDPNLTYCLEVDITKSSETNFTSSPQLKHNLNIVANNGGIVSLGQCDGDEDSVILLLDALLNFSMEYLPSKTGGKMDAPLVINSFLDPNEVDDEVHNMDAIRKMPWEFYRKTLEFVDPKEIVDMIDIIEHRLGTPAQYSNIGFSHPTSDISIGPQQSMYSKLETMSEKVDHQLKLASKIRCVDVQDVAKRILTKQFMSDLVGNLTKFGRQTFRCIDCNKKYRRVPLKGMCLECDGKIVLTVSKGTIIKYLETAKNLVKEYNLGDYFEKRLEIFEQSVNSIFYDKTKQLSLSKFI